MQIRFGSLYLIDSAALLQMEERIMSAMFDRLNAAIDKLSTADAAAFKREDTDLATLRSTIDDLKAQLANNSTMSEAEEQAIETRLAEETAKADAIEQAIANATPKPVPAPADSPTPAPATDPNALPTS